jgi:hypothetical protein
MMEDGGIDAAARATMRGAAPADTQARSLPGQLS